MTTRHRVLSASLALALAASALMPLKAAAQVPSNPAPYNVDLGALITNALRGPGTVTSSLQQNTNWRGVECTFAETVQSGSPSKSLAIQSYDAATGTYKDILEVVIPPLPPGAAPGTPYKMIVGPGITAVSNGTLTAVQAHLPRQWRISQTITGSTLASTSKVSCQYLL